MNKSLVQKVALFSLLAASVSCGGNPLIGRWSGDARPYLGVFAGSVTTATIVVEFRGDQTATTSTTGTVSPTAILYQNCQFEFHESGITWAASTSNGINTLTASAPTTSTEARTNCTNPAQNEATSPNGNPSGPRSWTYTITGNQLILTNSSGSATLTRQ